MASVRSVTVAGVATNGTAVSWAKPAGTVAGDVVYLLLGYLAATGTCSTPTGFTLLRGPDRGNSATTYLFRRVCNGTEGATFTATTTVAARRSEIAITIQDADTTTPEDAVTVATVNAAGSTNHVAPSITAVTLSDLLLCAFMDTDAASAKNYTAPGSMTEQADVFSLGLAVTPMMVASEQLAATGATGTRTATCPSADGYTTYSILVRSAFIPPTPAVLPLPFVFPAPDVTADGTAEPAVLPLPFVFPAASVATETVVPVPGVVAMPFVFPAPGVSVGTPVFPDVLPMALAFLAPSVTGDSAVPVPAAHPMPFVFPAPTVAGDTTLTVPAVLPLPFVFPAASVATSASVSPSVLVMPFVFPAPTVRTDTAVAVPAALPMAFAFPAPTILRSVGRSLELQWSILGSVGRSLELQWSVFSEARYVPTISDDDLLDLRFIGIRSSCFRYDLLDGFGNVLGQIHPDLNLSVPTVSNDTGRGIKRDLRGLALAPDESAEINAYTMRVRPVMVLENGSEYPFGTFLFVEGSRSPHTYGRLFSGSLLDYGWLVDQPTETGTNFATGTSIAAAIGSVLASVVGLPPVVIDGFDDVLGSPVTWQAGASRLKIVNDLCALAGCYDLYFDRWGNGRIRVVPDDITLVAPTVTYVDGSCGTGEAVGNILEGTTIETENLLDSPNRFVVIDNQAKDSPIVGRYDIPDSAPNSFYNRGFRIVQVVNEQGLQSEQAAVARAKAEAAQAAADFSWWSFQGLIDPRHDTYDVLSVRGRIVREQKWSTAMAEGAPHSHDVRLAYS